MAMNNAFRACLQLCSAYDVERPRQRWERSAYDVEHLSAVHITILGLYQLVSYTPSLP